MKRQLRSLSLALTAAAALALAACSDDGTPDAGGADSGVHPDATVIDSGVEPDTGVEPDSGVEPDTGVHADAETSPDAEPSPDAGGSPQAAEDCDPIMPAVCALPWPSNLYLKPDVTRETGYTLTFGPTTLPENVNRQRVDPSPYTRLDGYGLGEAILVLFPNLDVTGIPDEYAIEDSLAPDAKILLFEERPKAGLVRIPYFAELDHHETDPSKQILFVRPAVLLRERTRYVVAFRDLADTNGAPIAPSEAFAKLVAGTTASDPLLAPRQAGFDAVFASLEVLGIDRSSLTLAWDFSTASSEALHDVLLSMRDQALAAVGERGPELTITSTTEYVPAPDGSGRDVDEHIAYEFQGTITVPRFVRQTFVGLLPGFVLNLDANRQPRQSGTTTVPFWIRVPYSAVTSTATHDLLQFGHGLLGSGEDIRTGYTGSLANDHHFVAFSASLDGMSDADMQTVGAAVQDFSAFPFTSDKLYQGLVNWLVLARAMRAQLPTRPELVSKGVRLSDTLHYSGNSQGGIFGATYMTLSTEIQRGHLGVPGQNYSTLLHRSVDFDPFFVLIRDNYPSPIDQAIALSLIQQLWNGTDPVTWYRHLAIDPLRGSFPKDVIISIAKGDHQVAPLTMEIVSRSELGLPLLEDYDSMRAPFGAPVVPYPHVGSGMILFDFGNPWPEAGNRTPDTTIPDPHGRPRRLASQQRQMAHFYRTGEIIDVCGGDGCRPE
ncbi:hypothetical protein L6R52_19885 [Myxococcota bacterium]|nr:hypothetical protein [Myxococcota bacterium]